MLGEVKNSIREQLQKEILTLQGFRVPSSSRQSNFGIRPIENAFPHQTFPTGAIHEFLSRAPEDAAATSAFMAGLIQSMMLRGGVCLWISRKRTIFPSALKIYGLSPEKIIFIDLRKDKDVLWAFEEALKCESLSAVVAELNNISFSESRRLQLVVERSRVTGFVHRCNPQIVNTLACVSRWQISPVPSKVEEGMPGVGFARWRVELSKVRNGEPGTWLVEWSADRFRMVEESRERTASGFDLLAVG